MYISIRLSFFLLFVAGLASNSHAAEWENWELTGFAEGEFRYFPQRSIDPRQSENATGSVAFEPEFYRVWDSRDLELTLTPFFRFDSNDSKRTHFDVRELSLQKLADQWELRFGVDKVFWGVTESQHLVDTINQTDLVENIDTEDKLGQPMLNLAWLSDLGTLNLFYLPFFRERTFPGIDGRLRSQPYVDTDRAIYESGLEEWHPDFAARWSHVLGDFDVGVHYFYGTSRDPLFSPFIGRNARLALQPVYNLMHQGGLDVQWTKGGWMLKAEAIVRSGKGQHFQAFVSGFEYTFYNVADLGIDVGTLGEYHYDSRGDAAITPFNHDIFAGTRITLNDENDTAILGGIFWDHENDTTSLRMEFERRIGERYTFEFEAQKFLQTEPADLISFFRKDSFIEISIRRYF